MRSWWVWIAIGSVPVLDQWLFYATKESFLSRLAGWQRFSLLFESLLLCFLILLPFFVLLTSIDGALRLVPKAKQVNNLILHYVVCLMFILPLASMLRTDVWPKFIFGWVLLSLFSYVFFKKSLFSVYDTLSSISGALNLSTLIFCVSLIGLGVTDRIFYSISGEYLSSSQPAFRWGAWIIALLLSIGLLNRSAKKIHALPNPSIHRFCLRTSVILFVLVFLTSGAHWLYNYRSSVLNISPPLTANALENPSIHARGSNRSLPNILLIGIDGVYADHLSAYGYTKETSPNIDVFAQSASVYVNVFANTGSTSGSLASVLTGKRPETTGFFKRPEILRGEHSVEHLPRLLKNLGYTNYQITDRYWSDSRDVNMLGAFDVANGRQIHPIHPSVENIYRATDLSGFLVLDTFQTSIELLKNMVFMKAKYDPYKQVADFGRHPNMEIGEGNLNSVLKTIDSAKKPFFIHAHFLDTHGPWFYLKSGQFINGEIQQEKYQIDYYDSSIFDFDLKFGLILNKLRENRLYENSLIILFSDHGLNHDITRPVPLIIKLPAQSQKTTRAYRQQLIDIAPTILDALHQPIPHWMEGESLLSNPQD